jgi:Rad3-related DNA helicase
LDPKISELVSSELSKKAVVVFDEAHNIGMYLSKINISMIYLKKKNNNKIKHNIYTIFY